MRRDKGIVLKDIITFLYLYPVRFAVAVLPLRIVRSLGSAIGYIYSIFAFRRRMTVLRMLSVLLKDKISEKELNAVAYKRVRNSVTTFLDDLLLNRIDEKALFSRAKLLGMENLESAVSEGGGVILISGHFSGDRAGKRFLYRSGYPVLSVRKKLSLSPSPSVIEERFLAPLWSKILDCVVDDYVYVEDREVGIRILKRLREGGIVSVHIDAVNSTNIRETDLLGRKRKFSVNFLKIARLSGAAVVPVVFTGNSSSFSVIFGRKVDLKEAGDEDSFISANLKICVSTLEAQILNYPSQWMML